MMVAVSANGRSSSICFLILVATVCHSNLTASAFVPFSSISIRRTAAIGSQSSRFLSPLRCKKDAVLRDNQDTSDGSASIPNLSISLIKSIVGSGVLALPAGVANLGDSSSAILPAILLICTIGGMNAYFFSLIGRVCYMTGASSFREAWITTAGRNDYSSSSSWTIPVVILSKTALSCLAFSIIIADSFTSLAVSAGVDNVTRTQLLVTITAGALLPLCMLRNLKSLAPFSFLGIVGMALTTASMWIRYLDGSYEEGGMYHEDILANLQPRFGDSNAISILGGAILSCTLATAFVAHYNAPRFFAELRDNTVERFDHVVSVSFLTSAIFFCLVAVVGFLTFGSHSDGFILNNYSPYDPLLMTSRAAVAISLVLTYPLPFCGLRDGVLDLVGTKEETNVTVLTAGLLTLVTLGAIWIQDLALVLAVGGGTFSTAVTAIFPTIMYRAAVQDSTDPTDAFRSNAALVLMWVCIAIGGLGVSLALQSAFQSL